MNRKFSNNFGSIRNKIKIKFGMCNLKNPTFYMINKVKSDLYLFSQTPHKDI